MDIRQYGIYEIDLSGTIKDDELPYDKVDVVILSPDEMNEVLRTVMFAPIGYCENDAITPTTFLLDNKNARIRLDQISTLSKARVTNYKGRVSAALIPKIKQTINEMLVK